MATTIHDIIMKYIIYMFIGVFIGTIINELFQTVSILLGASKCLTLSSCFSIVILAVGQLVFCGMAIELMSDYIGTNDLGFYALGIMTSQQLLISEIITIRGV